MANYTEAERSLILREYREYCQTKRNTYKLKPEDKLVLMEHIKEYTQFDTYDHRGYVFYKHFAIPYCLPTQSSKLQRRAMAGEGLSHEEQELLTAVEEKIQTECLIRIWEGYLPDVCLLHASIIELGYGEQVLPKPMNRATHGTSKISEDARILWNKRKQDKLKATKERIRKQFGQDNQ